MTEAAETQIKVQILGKTPQYLEKLSQSMSLGLSQEEMIMLQNYFKGIGRDPTDVEMQAMAQAWSEHCCYKSSKFYLRKYFGGLEKHDAILAMEDDAGVVAFDDDYAYVLKMESHNHPSAIEPYGGAATGVGGIIRDVLCMGAQPIALVDSIYFGEVWAEEWKEKTLHPRFILNSVVGGIRDYGNRVGLPNVAGSVDFDRSFNHSPLVNAGCIGIVRKDGIIRSFVSKPGDIFVLAGGRTGRDGIHGVNFASANLQEKSGKNKSVVQLGNPIVKEPLIHAVLEASDAHIVDGMKDLGGGGLSSSVGEMCLSGGVAAEIDLENVLLKEPAMQPWEIWISESQERMLMAIDPSNLPELSRIFEKWDIEFSVIGRIVEGNNLIIRHNGLTVLDLDLDFLTSGPVYCRNYEIPDKKIIDYVLPAEKFNLKELLMKFLANPENCARFNITRQYDHTVRGSTVIRPMSGEPNHETHSDAAIIKPVEQSNRGLAITAGSRYDMVAIDPLAGTLATMTEAYLNILATGSMPNSVVDCINLGNPEDPIIMGQLVQISSAISEFCRKLALPVVAGNVSLYNQYSGTDIKPVPNIMMVGITPDVAHAVSTDFKKAGSSIYIIGKESSSLGGSRLLKFLGIKSSSVPWFDMEELASISGPFIRAAGMDLILAAHDISSGGLIQALLEMSFGSGIGFSVDLSEISPARTIEKLFSEGGERILVEVSQENDEKFMEMLDGIQITRIGSTIENSITITDLQMPVLDGTVEEFREAWVHGLDNYI
ncbi:MAG: phosphoribosylformylglycinamidine synthase subunit PurL [Candidatus Thermoplasmatota archaeon]|nr:phosphoribosylformylglycinamidine synthase subunit PurL [Candidatus Thermoplasmatota archaeon]